MSTLRVSRKLGRASRGALTWARAFGDGLVCVRHRVDPLRLTRYTTVEIVVHQVDIQPRSDQWVELNILGDELEVHRVLRSSGGRWDSRARIWRAPRTVVMALGLQDRITAIMSPDTA